MEQIDSILAEAYRNEIRDENATGEVLRHNLLELGKIVAQNIIEKHFLVERSVTTPTGEKFIGKCRTNEKIVVISTKDDYQCFGKGIAESFPNSEQFFMNFEGKRGLEALTCPIREMNLKDVPNVEAVLIAKSVLATGCTAISLTRRAVEKYNPRILIIASVFYSEKGVMEVQSNCKSAQIYSIGLPEELREDGMLIPGFGDLDRRLASGD